MLWILAPVARVSADPPQPSTPINQEVALPFLKKYCLDCHGKEETEGGLDLYEYDWDVQDNVTAQDWQDVLDVLNSGDMPPREAPQPSDLENAQVIGSPHRQPRAGARSAEGKWRGLYDSAPE